MSKLVISTNNQTGISAYIDQETGEAYLSQTLLQNLMGCHHDTLTRILESKGVRNYTQYYTETLTAGGLQVVQFLINASDISIIINDYLDNPRIKNKEQTRQLRDMLMVAGTTAYVYNLCGYEMKVIESPSPTRVLPEKYEVAMGIEQINNGTLPASIKQLLIDSLVNEYIDNTPKLPVSTERWLGVVQKAQELGFKTNMSNRGKLGMYVKHCQGLTKKREERICNGSMREIWVYLDNKTLESAIREYFALETLV